MRVDDEAIFRKMLEKRGFNGASLARAVGCSRAAISYLAKGERTCTPTLAHKIAEALEVPYESIFAESVSRTALQIARPTEQKKVA